MLSWSTISCRNFRKPLLYKRPWSCRCRRSSWHGWHLFWDVIWWWVSYCVCGWSLLEYIQLLVLDTLIRFTIWLSIFLVVYCCNYGSTEMTLILSPSFTVGLVKDVWWAFNVAAIVWISKSDPEISSSCNSYSIHTLNILCSQHQTHIIHQRGPRRLTNYQSPIPIPSRHLPWLPQELQRIHSILSRTSLSPNMSNISEASAQSHLPRYACYGYRCIG